MVTFTPNGSSTPAKSQETTVKVTATSPATVSSRGAGVYYLHIKATDNAGNP